MPKFIVTVIHSGQKGRITIDASSDEEARERAVFDGYKVVEVALAMPDAAPVAPVKPLPTAKASVGVQLMSAAIGFPGIGGLVALTFHWNPIEQFLGLFLSGLLGVVYWGICKPKRYASLWSTFWALAIIPSVLFIPEAIQEDYGAMTQPDGMSAGFIAHFVLQIVGLGLLTLVAFSRMKETP